MKIAHNMGYKSLSDITYLNVIQYFYYKYSNMDLKQMSEK